MSEQGQKQTNLDALEDLMQYKTISTWFSRGKLNSETTIPLYLKTFGYFMTFVRDEGGKFANMTPDDLIKYQKKSRRSTEEEAEYEIIDKLIHPWIASIESGLRYGTVTSRISTIKSFFKWNRAPLPNERIGTRAGVPKVVGMLPFKDIREICLNSTPVFRAIFLCMYMGAMDQALFRHWNTESGYKSIEDDIKNGSDIIIVRSPGRKQFTNKLPFYTMIGGDAVDALRKYVKGDRKMIIDRFFGDDPEKATAIFYNQKGNPIYSKYLAQYWLKRLKQLGLIVPIVDENGVGNSGSRYGKNPHEMRDTWRSKATSFFMPEQIPLSIFEFWMGHVSKMDPNLYDKYCKNEVAVKKHYRKVLPYYNIMTSNKALGLYDEAEVEKEREKARSQGLPPLDPDIANMRTDLDLVKDSIVQIMNVLDIQV